MVMAAKPRSSVRSSFPATLRATLLRTRRATAGATGIAIVLLAAVAAGCSDQTKKSPGSALGNQATLVLRHGVIYTADANHSMATSIALQNDRILVVGTDADVDTFVGANTKVIELNGRFVVPGLIDSHMHAVSGAVSSSKCSFADKVLTVAQMKPIVQACLAKETNADGWFQVVSVNPSGLVATANDIDGLVSDRPAVFVGSDGHTAWLNTAALAKANINKTTPDPEGGKIERGANGEATGKLIDAALGLALAAITQPTTQQQADALSKALPLFAAAGITSLRDPAVDDDVMDVYEITAEGEQTNVTRRSVDDRHRFEGEA